jgi:L-arabinonolactonase
MTTEKMNLSSLLEITPVDSEHCDFVVARLLLDCRCDLGEGIIYDDRKNCVLWTDINHKKLHKLDLTDVTKVLHTVYDLSKQLGSFGLLETESESLPLLCAWEDSFQLYDVELQKPLGSESVGEDVNPMKGGSRLNDGRVEPQGNRFLSGGHNGGDSNIKMKVFQCEQSSDGTLVHRPIIENVSTTNSLCWSTDSSKLYFADSPTRQIYSFDYNSTTGCLSNKTLVHTKNIDEHSVPDGSCMDSEGYIWNAVWRAGAGPGMVHRIDPNSGQIVFTVHMPDGTSQVTCCCFGGKDMDILFITSAAEGRDAKKEPHAGGLYCIRLPFKGRREGRLKFTI